MPFDLNNVLHLNVRRNSKKRVPATVPAVELLSFIIFLHTFNCYYIKELQLRSVSGRLNLYD